MLIGHVLKGSRLRITMKINVVNKSEYRRDQEFSRLDAEFMDKDLLEVEHALASHSNLRVANILRNNYKIYDGKLNEGYLVEYISIDSVDVEDGFIFHEEFQAETLPSRAKYIVEVNDILVSNVRPNRGAITIIGPKSQNSIASSGFSLIRVDPKCGVSPEFVFAFLKTDFGRNQLIRRNRGSMYPAVVADDVFDLWLPKPPENVEKEVVASVTNAIQWQELFYKLNKNLEEELNGFLVEYGEPPNPLVSLLRDVDWTNVSSKQFFDPSSALRFDAEFFRKGYKEFDERCQKLGNSFLLGDFFDLTSGRALVKGEEPILYAKQAVLTNIGINWSALAEEYGSLASGATKIQPGDILLACTAHEVAYVGKKVDFVRAIPDWLEQPVGCVPDLMVIRPKQNKPASLYGSYVAGFLRHPAGLYQVQRCIRGVRGGHVYRDDLSKFVRIPLPSENWLEEFEDISRECEAARNSAKSEMKKSFELIEDYVKTLLP